jgi:hypothetical protein
LATGLAGATARTRCASALAAPICPDATSTRCAASSGRNCRARARAPQGRSARHLHSRAAPRHSARRESSRSANRPLLARRLGVAAGAWTAAFCAPAGPPTRTRGKDDCRQGGSPRGEARLRKRAGPKEASRESPAERAQPECQPKTGRHTRRSTSILLVRRHHSPGRAARHGARRPHFAARLSLARAGARGGSAARCSAPW